MLSLRASAVLAPLAIVPGFGPRVVSVRRLIGAGKEVADAGYGLASVSRDLAAVAFPNGMPSAGEAAAIFRDLDPVRKREIFAVLRGSAPRLRGAVVGIDAAVEVLADPLVPTSVASERDHLLALGRGISRILPAIEALPSLLGHPDERRYLFFFQNNTELRPTGGFLGVYGTVRVKDGEMIDVMTDDIYALDGPSERVFRSRPPAPMVNYLGVTKWFLRDANWSPDFPTSAEVMERFYKEETAVIVGPSTGSERVDGIIVVTPELVKDVLRLIGPVTALGKTYTAENVVDQLEFQVEVAFVSEGIAQERRKDVVGKLLTEILRRLEDAPVVALIELVRIVDANLNQRHIAFAMKDPAVQRIVLERDWGGKILPVVGDYVSVIDANLAAFKSDQVVERTVSYAITPEGNGFVGTVAVSGDHRSRGLKTTLSHLHSRHNRPAVGDRGGWRDDDKLKDRRVVGKIDTYDELGRRAFGFISIELGAHCRSASAGAVRGRRDRLGRLSPDVEKQPGTVIIV